MRPDDAAHWDRVALAKLSAVLGEARAAEVFASVLRELSLTTLGSADDLYAFAQHVSKKEGFVGALGALLSVHAVIHGATAQPRN